MTSFSSTYSRDHFSIMTSARTSGVRKTVVDYSSIETYNRDSSSFLESELVSVILVFALTTPFEVRECVICLISVDMINGKIFIISILLVYRAKCLHN